MLRVLYLFKEMVRKDVFLLRNQTGVQSQAKSFLLLCVVRVRSLLGNVAYSVFEIKAGEEEEEEEEGWEEGGCHYSHVV